ncbi:DUF5707 domain-containing protein [Streptomyces cellulosae]|uniref:DUF5707 domain-containing protein n=1 Tax=Streptomyces cellulosae TaxID=1968 RepID=UPI0022773348|nr:DUF5707 domain-containing protein [Streptomyces cellulosae]
MDAPLARGACAQTAYRGSGPLRETADRNGPRTGCVLHGPSVAGCRRHHDETSRCTHTPRVPVRKAAELDPGTWCVSAPATAKDGGTVFLPRATTFELAH